MSYEPIKIPELEGNFCEARQFDWMSYLTSGDVAKYMEFRRMADTQDRSTQARALAVHVMGEIERVARCRMAEAPRPVSREVAPGETVKSADVLVLRARSKVLEMRRLYSPGDSDFRAGVKEACDAIGEALDMAPAPKPPTA